MDCCPTRLAGTHMICSVCGTLLCATHRVVAGSKAYCSSCARASFLQRRSGRAIA